jgi:hypothetical protein
MIGLVVRSAIGAAATIANLVTGQAVEYLGQAATLTLYGSGDIAGMVHTLAGFRGVAGDLYVPPGSSIPTASTAGAIKANENFLGQFGLPASSRLVHSVTNPGAASSVQMQYAVT